MRTVLYCFYAALLLACAPSETGQGVAEKHDILLVNGEVYIGEKGEEAKPWLVGITGNRISFIGPDPDRQQSASEVIDVTGLVVAPGFIDPHTHAQADLIDPEASHFGHYTHQGVTTILTGNDGGGPFNTEDVLTTIQDIQVGVNAGLFTGHNTLRTHVMGSDDRIPSEEELSSMRELLAASLQQGSFGPSAGLYYAPGAFAETSELTALAAEVARWGGVYESHIRDESTYSIGLLAAIEEAIAIGEANGVPVHIAHIKALGVDVWGKSAQAVRLIEAARTRGVSVTADQYPWAA
ncbi:MAG: hypothetical protein AAGA69_12785, partial [Pseudomonadota bacterium]